MIITTLLMFMLLALFLVPWLVEPRRLTNGLISTALGLTFLTWAAILIFSRHNAVLTSSFSFTALAFLFGIFFLVTSPWTFLLWNVHFIWKYESHSLPNLLTLVIELFLVALWALCRLGVSHKLPGRLHSLVADAALIASYLLFVMYSSLPSLVLYQIVPRRYRQDYLTVLGADLINGKRVSRLLGLRIDRATAFSNKQYGKGHKRPKLVTSGRQDKNGDLSKAEVMKNYTVKHGYDPDLILPEDKSTNTYQNMIYSKAVAIKDYGNDKFKAKSLTSSYHLSRAGLYVEIARLKVNGIGSTMRFYSLPNATTREFAGVFIVHKKRHFVIVGLVVILFIARATFVLLGWARYLIVQRGIYILQLLHLKKAYHIGDTVMCALDDVIINSHNSESVAIPGPSGSGKTTLLNVIGDLDHYDSGDTIINGKPVKNFSQADWDAYRNNSVGFIFWNYNSISHLSIIENIELGMTLSGVSSSGRHEKAVSALEHVGLSDHSKKHPNRLSGGQMRCVAIAQVIANDPDTFLCDEPTGALDTKTSESIMKLIKESDHDKLVIMVAHNPELAEECANRIVHFQDGKILGDSNPFEPKKEVKDTFKLKKAEMSYWNIPRLSFTSIVTERGKTFSTTLASSTDIVGIAIVFALSHDFQRQVNDTQSKTLAKFPISISQTATGTSAATNRNESGKNAKNKGYLTASKSDGEKNTHENRITQSYINYAKRIDPDYANNISFICGTQFNLLTNDNSKIKYVEFSNVGNPGSAIANAQLQGMNSIGTSTSVFPKTLDSKQGTFLKDNYQILAGSWPRLNNDVVLVLNNKNQASVNTLKNSGISIKDGQKLGLNKITDRASKATSSNDYYQELPIGNSVPQKTSKPMYDSSSLALKVATVTCGKNNGQMVLLDSDIVCSDGLTQEIIKRNENSKIVRAQRSSSINVMTNQPINEIQKEQLIVPLGGSGIPNDILIYPNSFRSKDKVPDYLDKYNKGKSKEDQIIYTDMSGTVTKLTGGLLDGITDVLIAFAGILLVASMTMIGILTYTSVLERTREIGVLKALRARKRDVMHVLDVETFILRLLPGILGIFITYSYTFPINTVPYITTNMSNTTQPDPTQALILVIVSTILTVLDGHTPARMTVKKGAAITLGSE